MKYLFVKDNVTVATLKIADDIECFTAMGLIMNATGAQYVELERED
jgi:hypothetical protein